MKNEACVNAKCHKDPGESGLTGSIARNPKWAHFKFSLETDDDDDDGGDGGINSDVNNDISFLSSCDFFFFERKRLIPMRETQNGTALSVT